MPIPSFSEANLEQVCNVLGDTSSGLTGSEIGRYLRECGIADPNPGMTKRIRLYEALVARQMQDRCANNVCAFIQRVMNPVLHVQSPDYFRSKQTELNRVLSFEGLRLTDQGTLEACAQARTISEAEAAADQLRRKLLDRGVHADVLRFCRAELVQGNYFHAVLPLLARTLMKGFFGTFRNPTAHAPRIVWRITEQDALDMMTVASLLHRRLDDAVKTGA